jgi:hypothetical protein
MSARHEVERTRPKASRLRFFQYTLGMAFVLDVLGWTRIARGDAGAGAAL